MVEKHLQHTMHFIRYISLSLCSRQCPRHMGQLVLRDSPDFYLLFECFLLSPRFVCIFSIVLLLVSLSLSVFLFPWGVSLRAIAGARMFQNSQKMANLLQARECSSIHRKWPIHLQCLCSTSTNIMPVFLSRSSFLIILEEKIFLRHLVWKVFNRFANVLVIYQHSLSYNVVLFSNTSI
jgi:hypothetical protein